MANCSKCKLDASDCTLYKFLLALSAFVIVTFGVLNVISDTKRYKYNKELTDLRSQIYKAGLGEWKFDEYGEKVFAIKGSR